MNEWMNEWWSPVTVILTFESVDEILGCHHSNETSSAVLSHGTIYIVCSSNFWVCGWNPMVLPFKWNLPSSILQGTIYLVQSSNFWVCGWNRVCDHSNETSLASTLWFLFFSILERNWKFCQKFLWKGHIITFHWGCSYLLQIWDWFLVYST